MGSENCGRRTSWVDVHDETSFGSRRGTDRGTVHKGCPSPSLLGDGHRCNPKDSSYQASQKRTRFQRWNTDYQKVANDVGRLLNDTEAAAVTTFIDYYGLPSDFPGMMSRPPGNPTQRAVHVETEWETQIANVRFHPYLMTHEFEALLFSNPGELSAALYSPNALRQLEEICASFSSPEEINESPDSAPSRRILSISPGYRKAAHEPMVARRIGLQQKREQCSHFNDWLDWLESL